ncbi:SemiSWEET transporter [Thiothrix subterranea]|uniref:SemiSWEET transporter n=1 Tax=Thiothrix subterranea TaxID=2735563 RepID=A0AA51MJ42_9GAMM|nr:SemiSWEET transporter [Thiothrix subterranea]MDQ5767622.1 SemiSWEET transporter [Thiothrix subterranea]WML85429.1 SemiSWEET transporter [Thiothrix subterranea]
MFIDVLGSVAGLLTTISFVPQAYQTLKTRETHSISLPMYIIFTSGVFCWMIYGFALNAWPIVAANVVTFILSASILVMKIRYG